MSNANLLIILSLFFSCYATYGAASDNKGIEPIQEVGQFESYMLDHPYKGCPTNSLCSKKMGSDRSNWLKTLTAKGTPSRIEKFRKKNGFPLNIWTKDTVIRNKNLILWDSFCPKHRPKPDSEGLIDTKEKIYIAQAWVKDFNHLQKKFKEGEQILINRAYVLESPKKVTTYLIPRAEAPLFISDKKLYFTVEEEGNYFGMWVSANGKIKLDQTYLPKKFPDEVKCPEPLSKAFKAGIINKNLYQGFFCKALWNQSTKKFTTIAIGWSCN